ncbi:GNAT family N-acetyltransferase [Oceaniglobus indicus]|uniref:GNAT family N-acetyltransferase n=1 Tax=Oceaniglobus indicus TaxID=2047749 RepID=UPI0013043B51|nr:GNAT family N-acetyltransferase [Oceaniglobus indicus]
MSVTFRAAVTGDIAAITDLWDAGWHQGHGATAPAALIRLRTRDSFADRVAAHLCGCFVAEHDGALAGFVMLEGAEVYQFYVAPAAQGRGVARTMMAEAEHRLHARGITDAWLACGVGNDRAARFYAKCGWRDVGRRREPMETAAGPFMLEIIRFEKRLP